MRYGRRENMTVAREDERRHIQWNFEGGWKGGDLQ